MGLAKRQMEEELERGWSSIGKDICTDCVTNPALKEIVEKNLEANECDYCGRTADEPIAADTDHVMEQIGESFASEYADPIEELAYESREGGYQGDWFDTWELYFKVNEEIAVDGFIEDMVNAYGDRGWTQRDYFISTPDQALIFSWERFAELVKYDQRFLILGRRDDEYYEPHEVEPAEMLTKIGALVVETGLVRELDAGTDVYRARPHAPNVSYTTAAELGTPPREAAFSNRMSPAGIPLFYGAFDAETVIAEVWPEPSAGKEAATIARFTTSAPLPVIDLAALPDVPSIFDGERRHLRAPLRFLHAFADSISEPVTSERSDRDVVAYVPTQVVSEYFRTLFGREQTPLRGMVFRSSRREGGTNCALFLGSEECVDAAPAEGDVALVLGDVETRG